MSYIRRTYSVPAKRGGLVTFNGVPGLIVGSDGGYLRVRLVGAVASIRCHPTWQIEYLNGPHPQHTAEQS